MVQQNAQNASQADALVGTVRGKVTAVHAAIGDLNRSMTDITVASQEIQKIIGTIDQIAFQTNLLALNAAVEAARAGEAGAGFAVVAGEVKSLAMKTAQEAGHIQRLLDATVERISACAASLKNINSDFDGIVESATMIGEKNSAITQANEEQSGAITQISLAINESATATQQIAAAGDDAAVQHPEIHRLPEGQVVEIDAVQGVVDGQELVGDVVGLILGPRLAEAGHPDVGVGVDEGRGDHPGEIGLLSLLADLNYFVVLDDHRDVVQLPLSVEQGLGVDDDVLGHVMIP